jgi:proline iminopeptidase
MLPVGDGCRVYWEVCGNPAGRPALVLHGGPGSGCTQGMRRWFDPRAYRVVLFDQRGAGRSRPHAAEPGVDLTVNTTAHLLADIERLRQHLGIESWLVFGISWGCTLALAYAERHPDRVTAMVLASVATTTRREIAWITEGVGMLLPEAWDRFRQVIPPCEPSGSLVDAYHRRLMSADPAVHVPAARDWCAWEAAVVALHPGQAPSRRYDDPRFRLGFARLVTHYWRHAAWLEEDILLRQVGRLAGIPAVLIHGRLDIGSPLVTPWRLARAWPGSRLVVVDAAGHGSLDPGMRGSIVAALDGFALS